VFSVLIPFFSYFVFALKNMVFLFGMNPVVWLKNQLREVVKIRKDIGVRNYSMLSCQGVNYTSSRLGKY